MICKSNTAVRVDSRVFLYTDAFLTFPLGKGDRRKAVDEDLRRTAAALPLGGKLSAQAD